MLLRKEPRQFELLEALGQHLCGTLCGTLKLNFDEFSISGLFCVFGSPSF